MGTPRGRSFAQAVLASFALASAAASTSCYTYRFRSANDSAAGLTRPHVLHSFFWGATQAEAPYRHCALAEDPGGEGLWQVQLEPTGLDIVARILTLGIWAPLHVSYDCAPQRPHLPAENAPPIFAAAQVPDTEGADRNGCYSDEAWENISGGVRAKPKKLCVPKPEAGPDFRSRVAPLERIVLEAGQANLPVRAVGAGWSFSQAPAGTGYMVDMRWFGEALPPPPAEDLAPAAKALSFEHFEAGTAVDSVNYALETRRDETRTQEKGEQLLTMGGSAGQTWIGAAQTGTHGSAIDLAPIADHVWALHVVGEGGKRVWIESARRPYSRGAFATTLGATYVRDDDVFDAALAGLGAFGVVYSAVVQVEPIHDYERHRIIVPLDAGLRAVMQTLDFGAWKDSPRPGQRPYHFEVVVDPYNRIGGNPTAYVTTLWKAGPHPPGKETSGIIPSDNVGPYLRAMVSADPRDVPWLEGKILSGMYKSINTGPDTKEPAAPLRYMFPKGIPQGSKPQSAEFDFPRDRFDQAITAILRTIDHHSTSAGDLFYYPGALGIRFVKQTRALLGATIYPDTVTVEFAGIPGVAGLDDFYQRVNRALWAAGVPHTQHLGQANTYMACPQELHDAFFVDGIDRIQKFRDARTRFLSPSAQATFSSEYTDTLGLTGAPVGGGPCRGP